MSARRPTLPTPKKARARAKPKPPDWAPAFLAAFSETHMVTEAAKRAGIHRDTAYSRRGVDEKFASAWLEVEERSTEVMEREAYRRAVDGWIERGIFDGDGGQVGEVRKFSDTLLIFMLKGRRPDTYREHHTHEHSGPDGGPIAAELITGEAASDAAHDFIERISGSD